MANYLNSLVSRLSERSPTVRPRVRGRFEPPGKNSQLTAVPLLSDISEESAAPTLISAERPVRPAAEVAEETSRTTVRTRIVKEREVHSESAMQPKIASHVEMQPTAAGRGWKERTSESETMLKDSPLRKVHIRKHPTNPNANSISLDKQESEETGVLPSRTTKEVQSLRALRIEGKAKSEKETEAFPLAGSRIEESLTLRESFGDARMLKPQIAQVAATQKTEPRARREQGSQEIQIVIGKITVQAMLPPQSAAPARVARPAPRLTLEQYLQQRETRR